MGESENQRDYFYYAQNDPVFTTLRAARVIHTHFEKERVVYQMCSLSLHVVELDLNPGLHYTTSVVLFESFPSLSVRFLCDKIWILIIFQNWYLKNY